MPHQPNNKNERRGVIGVIRRSDKYLVIRRSLTESAPGKICFPGGGIEAGESEEQALLREIEEEVGIANAEAVRRVWECRTPSGIRLGWWEARIPDDATAIPNPEEASECFWWTEEEMRACGDLLPTNLAFLDAIIASA
jgi:(d)CTP diphosphatase